MGVGYGWMDQSKASARRKDDAARKRDAAKQKKIAKGQSTFNKYIGVKPSAASSPAPATAKPTGGKGSTAQRTRQRLGEVRTARQNAMKDVLKYDKLASSGKGPDATRKARMAREAAKKRVLALKAGESSWASKGRKMGWTDKELGVGKNPASPAAKSVANATSDSGGSKPSGSGGSSTSGPGSKSTGPRMGAAIRNARSARENTTGIAISPAELKRFMARYENSHSGNLSRENAVLLARLVKKRGGKAAAYYGLLGSSPNPYDSAAPGTGIH